MPFKSERQRRFMFAKHPEIAERWRKEGKAHVARRRSRLQDLGPGRK